MNRLIAIAALLTILIMPQAWGATSQYQSAYRQTMWNNLTDGAHTLGQTPRQAAFTKAKLRRTRTKARINSINRAKRQAWLNNQ